MAETISLISPSSPKLFSVAKNAQLTPYRAEKTELKNRLIQEGRYTGCVDELIFKVVNAPVKKMKIEHI